jgi:hypothetical protein
MKTTDKHIIVSTNQLKGTFVNVLFEPRTKLTDSLTYDITAWSLPYAYGLDAIASESLVTGKALTKTEVKNEAVKGAVAYLADWNSMKDAKFLSSIIQKGIRVRYAENAFVLNNVNYEKGTLIITRGDNRDYTEFPGDLIQLANEQGIQLTPTPTGMVDKGNDFGSSSVKLIQAPKVAVLMGEEASSLNVGEVWHFFENQLNYPVSMIQSGDFSKEVLARYSVLIVPEGYYSLLGDSAASGSLKEWISNGGKVIAMGESLGQFTKENGFGLKVKSTEEESEDEDKAKNDPEKHEHPHIAYNAQEREFIKQTITGAIFKCKVETTNPLAFGYRDSYYSLKLSATAYEFLENGANVMYLEEKPELIAGFAGCEALKNQPKSLIIGQENMGSGCLIYMVDNPLFRGFWENGKLMFVNALFLANN